MFNSIFNAMKTNYLVCLFLVAMMALAACTEERIVYIEKSHGIELQPGEGIIELSVASALTTRAARPVVGSEATNNVNRVAFKFFDHNEIYADATIVGVYSSDGTVAYHENNKVSIVNHTDGDGASLLVFNGEGKENVLNNLDGLILKLDGLNASDDFKIVAYGYNQSVGTGTDLSGVEKLMDEDSFKYFQYTVDGEDINSHMDEEIFAGYVQVVVNQFNKLDKEGYGLTLERQVSGALAYFSKVPVYIKDASNQNKKVAKITVSTGLHIKEGGIYFPASLNEQYNGYIKSGEYKKSDLLTFDLSDASYTGDGEYGSYYKFTDGFLLADEVKDNYDFTADNKPFKEDNVLFGGCFLCPFNNDQGESVGITIDKEGNRVNEGTSGGIELQSTLNIMYYDEEGKIIKVVPLRLVNPEEGYDAHFYNIRRNHFYSMGDLEDGPLVIDPGSGSDELKLFLSDAWKDISLTNESEN